jgi:Arc/MetJ family transcription regulator
MARKPYFLIAQYGSIAILLFVMKMTMHIDEDVLDRVMKITGAKTKRAAVEFALNEMARRHKLKELLSQGLGLTGEQLAAEFAPGPADALDDHGWKAAEDQARYGDKPASS